MANMCSYSAGSAFPGPHIQGLGDVRLERRITAERERAQHERAYLTVPWSDYMSGQTHDLWKPYRSAYRQGPSTREDRIDFLGDILEHLAWFKEHQKPEVAVAAYVDKAAEKPQVTAPPTKEPLPDRQPGPDAARDESTAKPTAEPTAEPTTEPVAEPIAEPIAEPVAADEAVMAKLRRLKLCNMHYLKPSGCTKRVCPRFEHDYVLLEGELEQLKLLVARNICDRPHCDRRACIYSHREEE